MVLVLLVASSSSLPSPGMVGCADSHLVHFLMNCTVVLLSMILTLWIKLIFLQLDLNYCSFKPC